MLMHEKTCVIPIFIRELHPWIDWKLVHVVKTAHIVLGAGSTIIRLKAVTH